VAAIKRNEWSEWTEMGGRLPPKSVVAFKRNMQVLSYNDRDVSIPAPNETELATLEDELQRRTDTTIADLKGSYPEARPNKENCTYCSVRHLCEEYWQWHARGGGKALSPNLTSIDIQINLTERHGPLSWNGIVESSSVLEKGQHILLRISDTPFDLRPGQKIRLLNTYLTMLNEDRTKEDPTIAVATVGTNSELFCIPQ